MRPLLGAIPSPPDSRDLHFEQSEILAGAVLPEGDDVDVTDAHVWRVQGAQSCVSYTMVQQAQDLSTLRGTPLPLLSGAWPYGGARILLSAPIPGVGLPDTGSSYSLNLKWGRDRGLVTETTYPDVPENIPAVPPKDVWDDGGVASIGRCHRIAEGESMRAGLIQALKLAKSGLCSPPGSVIPVDDAYGALGVDDIYIAKGGNPWGYHAQIIGAYSSARRAFAMLSTWDKRIFWVHEDWLAQYGFEFWVIENLVRSP